MSIKKYFSADFSRQKRVSIKEILVHSFLPRLDIELILAFVLKKNRAYIKAFSEVELTEIQLQQVKALIDRRSQGEPLAYLIEEKEFWSLPFYVNAHALIPRPETERIVEIILDHYADQENFYLADIGVGCGTIALTLAKERPRWKIYALDIDPQALNLARINAHRFEVENVFFKCGEIESLPDSYFNAIVSNPPYLSENEIFGQSIELAFEPRHALVGGETGLEIFEKISAQAKFKLLKSGCLIFEHGFNQAEPVKQLLYTHGFNNLATYCDLAGHERVTCGFML